jgi:ABC-2 type transport system ATP-binding protein
MSPAVETDRLCRSFGLRAALSDVTFAVRDGELFGLLGPNGSGKSTLFRILSTLLPPGSGTARVGGHDVVREATAVRHAIGVVFQSAALDPQLTVEENLRCAGRLYGLGGPELQSRLHAAAADLEVSDRLADQVRTLSGGLQRRVEIAKVLLPRPRVLLLDEPSTGLDPAARSVLRGLLAKLRRGSGVTIVLTTHLLEEAEGCDRVAVLHRGKLAACDAPAALRGRLGRNTAVLSGTDPEMLAAEVGRSFGWPAEVRDGRVLVDLPADGESGARLVRAFEGAAERVSVGRPTLEDAFLELTGEPFPAEEDA